MYLANQLLLPSGFIATPECKFITLMSIALTENTRLRIDCREIIHFVSTLPARPRFNIDTSVPRVLAFRSRFDEF